MHIHRYVLLVAAALVLFAAGLFAVVALSDEPMPGTTTSTTLDPTTTLNPTTTPPTTVPAPSTTSPSDTTEPPSTTTTTTSVTPSSEPPGGEAVLELASAGELGNAWQELFTIPYGDDESRLGTSLGGDGKGFSLGPDYGAQAPDGTWWFLDAAKKRLAHYSGSGEFIDAVTMKSEHLVNGQYFQFQLPRVLDDGTLVAARLGGSTTLLLLEEGDTRTVTVPTNFGVRADDGEYLYGFAGEDREMTKVDPYSGQSEKVDWFHTRAGTRFRLEVAGSLLTVEMPDAANPRLDFRLVYAGDPSTPAFGMVEAASGEDGSVFLYIIGGTDTGDGGQLVGFLAISADGVASPLEASRNPFTTSDPGSPAHLGIRPGTSSPWLMFIDNDGVRVFTRQPASGAAG